VPALYVPDSFRESETPRLHDIVERYAFGTLITSTPNGPLVSHVPFILDRSRGELGTLSGHVARANPHARELAAGPALVVFMGPHAYVSPTCYEPRPDNVPTWNYAVVHAAGQPQLVDAAATMSILKRLVERYESGPESYSVDPADAVLQRVARGVVAFEMPIAELTGKFKLSQNRSAEDRARVVERLRSSGEPLASELAELMTKVP
jgi:transcriptional regulator